MDSRGQQRSQEVCAWHDLMPCTWSFSFWRSFPPHLYFSIYLYFYWQNKILKKIEVMIFFFKIWLSDWAGFIYLFFWEIDFLKKKKKRRKKGEKEEIVKFWLCILHNIYRMSHISNSCLRSNSWNEWKRKELTILSMKHEQKALT